MSRKGNRLLSIPNGITVTINPTNVVMKNAKNAQLVVDYPKSIKVTNENNTIKVTRLNEEKQSRIMHGTVNALIANALIGLEKPYKKTLKIVGVGYKAAIIGKELKLAIGFTHPVIFQIPEGITVTCPVATEINIEGFDKIVVGELAANIRKVREPEPYNGKGIMYSTEKIIRKVGKTAESAKK